MKLQNATRSFLCALVFVALLLPIASTRPAQAQPPSDPAVVLRDILMAACAQDSDKFGSNLTTRNADAYGHMTSAARTTLLKRFVLLDKAGAPRAETDNAGNLTVLCVTPDVTTQLKIGKAEIRDNLAYLPLLVKDATDTTDANARRVTMGLVRDIATFSVFVTRISRT